MTHLEADMGCDTALTAKDFDDEPVPEHPDKVDPNEIADEPVLLAPVDIEVDIDRVVRWLDHVGEDVLADKLIMARRRHRKTGFAPDDEVGWTFWNEGTVSGTVQALPWAKAKSLGLTDDATDPGPDCIGVVMSNRPGVIMYAHKHQLFHWSGHTLAPEEPGFDPWPNLRILAQQLAEIVDQHGPNGATR